MSMYIKQTKWNNTDMWWISEVTDEGWQSIMSFKGKVNDELLIPWDILSQAIQNGYFHNNYDMLTEADLFLYLL